MLVKKSKRAFTLVELVIVIAILAILAAIAIPTVSHLIEQAKDSAAHTAISNIHMALNVAMAEEKVIVNADKLFIPTNRQEPDTDAQRVEDAMTKILGTEFKGKYIIMLQGKSSQPSAPQEGDLLIYYGENGARVCPYYEYRNEVITKKTSP